ncbi:MAG: hypothetical protein KF852_17920 [Saprospiraceae bacterium]|nr:hypothetical protein [Saprospiraceae bacterium]
MTTLIIFALLALAFALSAGAGRHRYHSRPITQHDYIHHDYRSRRPQRGYDDWDEWDDYDDHRGNPVLAWILAIVIFGILFFYVTS